MSNGLGRQREEDLDYLGIKLSARLALDLVHRFIPAPRIFVRPFMDERIEYIRDRYYPALQWDGVSA